MENEKNQDSGLNELIDESIRLELSVSDLYRLFAEHFPEDREFWSDLASEEIGHATLIRSGKEYFEPLGLFPRRMIHDDLSELKKANAYVVSLTERARSRSISRMEAFTAAFALENTAGEVHFQRFVDREAESTIEKIFKDLNHEDREHARRIREYMERNGIGSGSL